MEQPESRNKTGARGVAWSEVKAPRTVTTSRTQHGVAGVLVKPLASRAREPVFGTTSSVTVEKSLINQCLAFQVCKPRLVVLTPLGGWRFPVFTGVQCAEQSLAGNMSVSLWSVTRTILFFGPWSVMHTLKPLHEMTIGFTERTDVFHGGGCYL